MTLANAPASWSAAALRRFRWERARGIPAVHGKPTRFDAVPWNHEPVGRVTPCAPQFGNAQTARRGLTRPTFRFMESPLGLAAMHWDCERVWTNACSICYTHSPGSFVGSWKASSAFLPCIGTLNLTVWRDLFGVPPSGGPDRLKPGHQTVGSWKALSALRPCIRTLNQPGQIRVAYATGILQAVLLVHGRPFRFSGSIGTMNR